ncbi:transposase [Verminephrobacter eiseniae]|uniref:transposase n=1 Tax=Verminephrobacter eiseniae TaxID=364317 RepID=UPI002237600F|nr:transposase [Verminephrobacter eiseniae]
MTKRLVVGHTRDGRCIYDEQAKRELILACREPGASVSKLARDCGVNANQLSTWARKFELAAAKTAAAPASSGTAVTQTAFVAVHIDDAPVVAQSVCVDLQARLPNGVVVDLRACDMRQARGLLDALGRLQCSASTKG